MGKLNIIRASAGSGKTHYLTGFFLKQLFRQASPDYFKHILAVTFTNKATEEMKSRLIEELYKLASDKPSDYISLLSTNNFNEEKVRTKAKLLLKKILHEYSWFSIETIDSFFQRVIRAFTRELGIPGNYAIELDTSIVLEYAVDHLIEGVGEDKELLNWLIKFTEDKIQEGKSWDFRNDLLELGKELFKESFSTSAEALELAISDRQQMKRFRENLSKTKSSFEKHCSDIGKRGLDLIEKNNLTDDDFYQKKNGAIKIFRMIHEVNLTSSSGALFISLKVMEKLLESPQNWASGNTTRKSEIGQLAQLSLLPLLEESVVFISKEYTNYVSALTLLRNLFALGILVDLSTKIKQYRHEKNTFILSDAPVLIERLIKHNDTPFIYEKMGNRYAHLLIDEFQDTSSLQWKNFQPLISNSLSQANDCLLVGDVKQSIYRWRNGEWEILARQIFEDYPEEVLHTHNLNFNWRSSERIVNFNSQLFSQGVQGLKLSLEQKLQNTTYSFESELELLQKSYSDVVQDIPEKSRGKGNVLFQFFSKKQVADNDDYYKSYLLDAINQLIQEKYSLKDIAILVRDKAKGKVIADFLIESNSQNKFLTDVNIISDESLLLSASIEINLLLAALRYIGHEKEPMYRAELVSAYKMNQSALDNKTAVIEQEWECGSTGGEVFEKLFPEAFIQEISSLRTLPLYELLERLVSIFQLTQSESNLAYIHAFLDLVHEYVRVNQGTIDRFLEYWETKGQFKSIPAVESQNAIRILTIHKAKGLEYRAVIIPFCNWNFNQKANSIFWVNMEEGIENQVPVFPVNYSKGLKDTVFAKDYYTELYRSYIDNLNLLYVALTRAKETLVVFPVYSDSGNTKSIDTVGDLLYDTIVSSGTDNFSNYFDTESQTLRIGFDEPSEITEPQTETLDNYIQPGSGKPAMDRLFFSTEGFDYFEENYSFVINKQLRGRVLHGILARIITDSDLENEISKAVLSGVISTEDGISLQQHILQCIAHKKISRWFDGSGFVMNESDILLSNGNIKRPDRVVIWNDLAQVIDYKFGSDKDEDKHRRQVGEYVRLLRKMGYPTVEGYIWYIDMNEVVALNEEISR